MYHKSKHKKLKLTVSGGKHRRLSSQAWSRQIFLDRVQKERKNVPGMAGVEYRGYCTAGALTLALGPGPWYSHERKTDKFLSLRLEGP